MGKRLCCTRVRRTSMSAGSSPCASVVMTQRIAGIEIDSVTVAMAEVDRAKLDGSTEGFLKVHLKKGSDKILGATIVAEHAGDIVGELALAIRAGIGLETIASTIHPYPTQAEVIKKAADAWRRTKLTPKIKKLFAAYFRMFRST